MRLTDILSSDSLYIFDDDGDDELNMSEGLVSGHTCLTL